MLVILRLLIVYGLLLLFGDKQNVQAQNVVNPMLPSWYAKATPEAQQAANIILWDFIQTKQQQRQRLDAWAKQQGPVIEAEYQAYFRRMMEMEQMIRSRIEQSLMSAEAKQAALKLLDISKNMNISPQEDAFQENVLMQTLSPEVIDEIQKFHYDLSQSLLFQSLSSGRK